MSIQLVGVNHRTAPVEVRERLALPDDRTDALARALVGNGRIEEVLVLSTCNRVEFLASAEPEALRTEVFRRLPREIEGLELDERVFYDHIGRDAVRHVFRVASSLDSMVVGEPQILGQVRAAFQRAKEVGTVGAFLDRLVTQAVRVARRVRTETGIGTMAVSVSSVAVELARKIFGDLDGLSVLLIGAGEMAESAAHHLHTAGTRSMFVMNRTPAGAERVAAMVGGEAVAFDRLLEMLQRVDIVVSSTGSPSFILSKSTAEGVMAARRNRPIFLVDIAVPRDIDPSINEVDNVFVYDMDDLQQVAAANAKQRRQEAERAERIVDDEVDRVLHRLRGDRAKPAIQSLQRRFESIRVGELERYQAKLRDLSEEQRAAVDAMTRSMLNKIAHHPISEVKRSAMDSRPKVTIDDIRRIFGLE